MRTIVLLLALTMSIEEFKIRCDEVCIQDGDKKGVVLDAQCGCWNPRDIRNIPIKIERTYRKEKPTATYYNPY